MENEKLMAIWKYDTTPFYMAGEVTAIHSEYVNVKGYSGISFKPVKLLPYDSEKLLQLKKLREDYATEERQLQNKYKKAAESLFKID